MAPIYKTGLTQSTGSVKPLCCASRTSYYSHQATWFGKVVLFRKPAEVGYRYRCHVSGVSLRFRLIPISHDARMWHSSHKSRLLVSCTVISRDRDIRSPTKSSLASTNERSADPQIQSACSRFLVLKLRGKRSSEIYNGECSETALISIVEARDWTIRYVISPSPNFKCFGDSDPFLAFRIERPHLKASGRSPSSRYVMRLWSDISSQLDTWSAGRYGN
jgi:hypothetical protein